MVLATRPIKKMKKTDIFKIIIAFLYIHILSLASAAYPRVYPTHLDRTKLPSGCLSCHAGGHGIKGTALLKLGTSAVCLDCHDANAKAKNINITHEDDIRAALDKNSRHPVVETAYLHRGGESFPEKSRVASRHVACEDCHEAHASTEGKPLERVAGLNSYGVRVFPASAEYEICYKCHGDSRNLPPKATNKRLEFNRNNPSFHPVESRGKSNNVPSLIRPMNEQSLITCSDCHGNDDPMGPKGPHGSNYSPILVLHYESEDDLQENNYQYALCYKCHDRSSILRDQSFPFHNLHIIKVKASCYTCHNSHGSQLNTHLIFFNPDVVGQPQQQSSSASLQQQAGIKLGLQQKQQSSMFQKLGLSALPQIPSAGTIGMVRYVDFGNGHGQCFLNCHGKEHNPLSY